MAPECNQPIRAALYLRQSLDATGEQLAVQRQREACKKIAHERGWRIVGEYVDNSISASDKRKARPRYNQLVADYAAGHFDAIVCWDLDRLTRQPRQLEDWIDAAEEKGLRLVTANGEADLTTDGGRLFARIKAAVARGEVERKGARQRAAAAQRAQNGRPPLGPRLTGYTTTGEILADEAAIVRELFNRFAAGDSLKGLAAWLTASKVPTRRGGDRWNPSSVATILSNPRYAGHAIYNGRPTGKAGAWQPIVSDDLYAITQSRLSDPRRKLHHAGTDRKYLGSSLYLCGVCDTPLISHTGRRYRCPRGCLTRAGGPIDDLVRDVIAARLAQPDLADLLPAADSGELNAVRDEAQRLRARLDRIERDYDSGYIDGRRYQVATETVRIELAAAENRLAQLGSARGASGAVLLAADPVAAFRNAPLMLQRTVVDVLCVVRVLPAPRGSRTFRPETVEFQPKVN